MSKVTPTTSAAAENAANVLIDNVIGTGEKTIRLFGDLRYVSADLDDYYAKLLIARSIPTDPENFSPNDPLIAYVANQPEILAMPVLTRVEQEARNRAVFTEITSYYARQSESARSEAMMLALTVESEIQDEPIPWDEEPVGRKRPGMITMPSMKRDISHPVERRLKQLVDRLAEIPDALTQVRDAATYLAVSAQTRLQRVDRDGFRGKPSS